MIRSTRQDWSVGSTVKVGFLSLRVVSVASIKDGLPDIYTLTDDRNGRMYEFVPHNGLYAI